MCTGCVYRINESNGLLLRNYAVLILSFVHRSCYSVREKWEQQQACTSNGGVSESRSRLQRAICIHNGLSGLSSLSFMSAFLF